MNNYSIILLSFVLLISGCEKNKQKDKSKPNIMLDKFNINIDTLNIKNNGNEKNFIN